jgi:hypothetical protein
MAYPNIYLHGGCSYLRLKASPYLLIFSEEGPLSSLRIWLRIREDIRNYVNVTAVTPPPRT